MPGGQYAIRFEERYSKEKWSNALDELKNVFDGLGDSEKENTIIWGKHYNQAGAVNLFGERYNLPKAFSLHGSFYNWTPNGNMPDYIIAIRYGLDKDKDFFTPFFQEVIPVKSVYNQYGDEEGKLWQTIFICKYPKQSFEELKVLFKDRIFE